MPTCQKKTMAVLAAVLILSIAGMIPAGAAEKEGGRSVNRLRGRADAAPEVFVASGAGLWPESTATTKNTRHAGTAILRVSRAAVKRKAALPDGIAGDQQCFKALSAVTDNRYYRVETDQVETVCAALEKNDAGGEIQIFPNIVKHLEQTLPNDPYFSDQWCHLNADDPEADMDSTTAWDVTTGSAEVVVALIDSGVDYTHPDLAANIWTNPDEIAGNGVDDDGNGYVDDIHGIDTGDGDSDPLDYDGHGSHVAGIMGAEGDNGLGVAGINWQVKIMVLKGFETSSDGMSTAMETEAIDYILAMKARGVNIVAVNASYGYTGDEDEVEKEAVAALGEAGILFMAAAGNDGTDNDISTTYTHYPSSYDLDNIVSVAASDADGNLTSWSSYGATSVDLAAPGSLILSTVMSDYLYTPAAGDLFFDDMESGNIGWTAEGTWAITEEQADSPTHAWSDSPNGDYVENTAYALTSPVIDLGGASGPLALGFSIRYDIEPSGYYGMWDSLDVYYLAPGNTWEYIGSLADSSDDAWITITATIPEAYFWEGFQFRFVMTSDYSLVYDGVYIDDVGIGVPETVYPYAYYSGTSMATPQVTGAAGLVAGAFPTLGADEIKTLLLDGTQPMTGLAGVVATGGLLNLAGALSPDGDGDSVPDRLDNCAATANADQTDTDDDGYGNACDCDLTNDGTVNMADFVQFRGFWGTDEALADFNGDSGVNMADFMIFRGRWGASAPFE